MHLHLREECVTVAAGYRIPHMNPSLRSSFLLSLLSPVQREEFAVLQEALAANPDCLEKQSHSPACGENGKEKENAL